MVELQFALRIDYESSANLQFSSLRGRITDSHEAIQKNNVNCHESTLEAWNLAMTILRGDLMKITNSTKIWAFFAMICFAIVLDQAIKFWILDFYANATSPHSKVFESPFIDIVLVFNKGVAFSFLSAVGANLKWIILAMLILMLLIVLKSKELFAENFLAFGLIIGGGFSNLLDRFTREGVVDYIFWHYKFNFAVFNLADSIINVAIAWIILKYVLLNVCTKNK